MLLSITAALTLSTAYLALGAVARGLDDDHQSLAARLPARSGRRLGPLRALARAAFCVVFPIGLFWCVVSPHRRSVQDVVLWTRVVYDWLPRPGHDDEDGHQGDRDRGHGRGTGDGDGDGGRLGPPGAGDAPPRDHGGDSGRAPHPDRPRP